MRRERQHGDLIEIDQRRLFMDDEKWVPVTFIEHVASDTMSDAGDMRVEGADDKQFLWGRHYWRWPL